MIAVVQRVAQASVTAGSVTASIGPGLLILLGIGRHDREPAAEELAAKTVHLRIFEDRRKKMNRSLLDVEGAALVVSQFTLCADTTRGRRPGFDNAAPPEKAERLYELYTAKVRSFGVETKTGTFGVHMEVALINDGPVTLILESRQRPSAGESPPGWKGIQT